MNDLRNDLLRRVRDNLCDGASHLARIALDSLVDYTEEVEAGEVESLRRELLAFADELVQARPSMAAIRHLVERWRAGIEAFEGDLHGLRAFARDHADDVRNFAAAATDATVRCTIDRLGDCRSLLTYSMSSTVTRALTQMPAREINVVVPESRPRLEGWHLASALAEEGIAVTYITDAQAGIFAEQAEMVLVGADSILADGSIINKSGTRLVALAARDADVPFYVCAESFKCTAQTAAEVSLEEKAGSELRPPQVPGVRARNIYFEVTPAALITDWLSDEPLARRFGR